MLRERHRFGDEAIMSRWIVFFPPAWRKKHCTREQFPFRFRCDFDIVLNRFFSFPHSHTHTHTHTRTKTPADRTNINIHHFVCAIENVKSQARGSQSAINSTSLRAAHRTVSSRCGCIEREKLARVCRHLDCVRVRA